MSVSKIITGVSAAAAVGFGAAAQGFSVPVVDDLGLNHTQLAAASLLAVAVLALVLAFKSHESSRVDMSPLMKFQPSHQAAPSTTALYAHGDMEAAHSRREMFGKLATAGAAAAAMYPQGAFADGAVSTATMQRAKGLYGSRIAAISDVVKSKGSVISAVKAEKSAFVLYNSGVFAKDKKIKADADAAAGKIFAAAASGDEAATAAAYEAYCKKFSIEPLTDVDQMKGQGISTEFDFKYKTPAGTIYQR